MNLVILESPFAGKSRFLPIRLWQQSANITYARACMADSLKRGEYPLASHLLYTQPGILDDDDPHERGLGIAAGLTWMQQSEATVVYTDLGISDGMLWGIEAAEDIGNPVLYRKLEGF